MVLSDKGAAVLEDLPTYLRSDRTIQAIVDAVARELQRVEDFALLVRAKMDPQSADDEYGILGAWERLYGLPVQPPSVSLATRREILMAAIRRRRAGAGSGWVNLITTVLGSPSWGHFENTPDDYELTVNLDIPSTDYRAGQARSMLSVISPAHLQVLLSFSGRYEVGISEVGDPL